MRFPPPAHPCAVFPHFVPFGAAVSSLPYSYWAKGIGTDRGP